MIAIAHPSPKLEKKGTWGGGEKCVSCTLVVWCFDGDGFFSITLCALVDQLRHEWVVMPIFQIRGRSISGGEAILRQGPLTVQLECKATWIHHLEAREEEFGSLN